MDSGQAYIIVETEPTKCGQGGQRYRVWHSGEILVESSRNPANEAARKLLMAGADVDDIMAVRPLGGRSFHYFGKVMTIASYIAVETQDHGPRIVPWVPYFGPPKKEED